MINKKTHYQQGMVFGVFDGLHRGHKHFLREAERECNKLVVVVAQTKIIKILKKHPPKNSLTNRILKIKEFNPNFSVTRGDLTLGKWSALKNYNPDIVFLGYDQKEISKELKKIGIQYAFLKPYHPKKYKSHLLP